MKKRNTAIRALSVFLAYAMVCTSVPAAGQEMFGSGVNRETEENTSDLKEFQSSQADEFGTDTGSDAELFGSDDAKQEFQDGENSEEGTDGIRYIKGRPLTEEERKEELEPFKNLKPLDPGIEVESDLTSVYAAYGNREAAFPSSYDARKEGLVTPVKNQNPFGTCWAFGMAAIMETSLLAQNKGTYDLSEEHLSYFFSNRQNDPLGNTPDDKNYVLGNYHVIGGNAMLFRHQVFSYAILVKGQRDTIKKNTCECVEAIQKIMEETRANVDWFVAVGEEADRLSRIKQSYHTAARTYAFRYLYDGHILYYNMLEQVKENSADTSKTEAVQLKNVNINALNPEILQKFLSSGLEDEVDSFVHDYFHAIGREPMESLVFRNYVVLNVRFSVLSFLKKIGYDDTELSREETDDIVEETSQSTEASVAYAEEILKRAIAIRDENAGSQNRSVLKQAIDFIDGHYMDEEISLNRVAHVANVSANHFSALFSQNMGQTFIEYLTSLRMDKAKELLRCTSKRSSEIAGEVGYKDAHYFSYLFKKTQGMTPSEYRKTRGEV